MSEINVFLRSAITVFWLRLGSGLRWQEMNQTQREWEITGEAHKSGAPLSPVVSLEINLHFPCFLKIPLSGEFLSISGRPVFWTPSLLGSSLTPVREHHFADRPDYYCQTLDDVNASYPASYPEPFCWVWADAPVRERRFAVRSTHEDHKMCR